MKAKELIKEIIKDLTIENSDKYSEIVSLKLELAEVKQQFQKVQTELNYINNTKTIKQ